MPGSQRGERHPRVLVVGAGAGGIAAAVRLLQDGVSDLLVVDRSDGVGGVWRANTYPGAECDVPSHLYSLSFHRKPDWSRRFAGQAEILQYLGSVVEHFGLEPYLLLRTEVTDCRWDEPAQTWRVTLRGADDLAVVREADVVITATGQLSTPARPSIPGLDNFAGPVFHSARWRHDVDLTGRRVAVIGTGASAVQFVPFVAADAEHVHIFQRTPPYVISKLTRRYPALEQRMYARFPRTLDASRLRLYLWHELMGLPFTRLPAAMAANKALWKLRLRRAVRDPALRAQLTPDYEMGCKRLLRAPDYYRTLVRPDVSVHAEAITAVTPQGVRTADGVLHGCDVIILGTGFETTRFLAPMRVTGRGGRDLDTEWKDGARAYLGTAVSGFPNLFMLYGPGTNLGHSSIILMIEAQLTWVRSALRQMREHGLGWIDVRPEAQSAYDAEFAAAGRRTVWETGCDSWYTVNGRNVNNWPGSTLGFRRRTRRMDLADMESGAREPTPQHADLTLHDDGSRHGADHH
jgi:cation diffusion facilitator CzcD-associated flavoprotein CzcO